MFDVSSVFSALNRNLEFAPVPQKIIKRGGELILIVDEAYGGYTENQLVKTISAISNGLHYHGRSLPSGKSGSQQYVWLFVSNCPINLGASVAPAKWHERREGLWSFL